MAVTNKDVPGCPENRQQCLGLAQVLARVGDKWTILIVGVLSAGPLRYNEIRRRIGDISQRMLTLTLKGLEQDGLVSRTMYPTIPPRVDYELTGLGYSLRASLEPLQVWAITHRQEIEGSRERFSAKKQPPPVSSSRPVSQASGF